MVNERSPIEDAMGMDMSELAELQEMAEEFDFEDEIYGDKFREENKQ